MGRTESAEAKKDSKPKASAAIVSRPEGSSTTHEGSGEEDDVVAVTVDDHGNVIEKPGKLKKPKPGADPKAVDQSRDSSHATDAGDHGLSVVRDAAYDGAASALAMYPLRAPEYPQPLMLAFRMPTPPTRS